MTSKGGPDINVVISRILRYGLIFSSLIILAGIVLLPATESASSFPQSLQQLISANYGKPTLQIGVLLQGVAALNPLYIIEFGLLASLATPLVRVAASAVLFASEKDRIYVAVTLAVLAILLFSIFVVGPWAASGA